MSDKHTLETIAVNVTALAELHGLSGLQLAKATGIPQPTLYRIMNGQRISNVDNLRKIAIALHTSMDYLCEEHEENLAAKG